ncbi:MAG: TolC family protein [Magnetococcales bacterium]|nr:TolC family protein [Magnetococcales bacterium]
MDHSFYRWIGRVAGLGAALAGVAAWAAEMPQLTPAAGSAISLQTVLEATLLGQPDLLLKRADVESKSGALQAADGAFDVTLSGKGSVERTNTLLALADASSTNRRTGGDKYIAEAGVGKKWRSGVQTDGTWTTTRLDEKIRPNRDNTVQSDVTFKVTVPLGKGREDSTIAAEEGAKADLEAAKLRLRHAAATNIQVAVAAYWDYLEAWIKVKVQQEAEDKSRKLLEETRALIAGGEKPAAESTQLEANLADKVGTRLQAEQGFYASAHALGKAVGMPYDSMTILPPPADPFPKPDKGLSRQLPELKPLLERALTLRADHLALKQDLDSASAALKGAQEGMLPQVDLEMKVVHSGLMDNPSNAWETGVANNPNGLAALGQLTGKWPWGNNAARGNLLSKQAAWEQKRVAWVESSRTIRSAVTVALRELASAALSLEQTSHSAEMYRQAIANEQEKLRLGMATLLDVMTTEDKLISAMIKQAADNSRYAKALVKLRLESGTLATPVAEGEYRVGREEILQLPPMDGPS